MAYALSLHLRFSDETRHVIVTTTLIIVLFTTLILGGSTMPLMKFLQADKKPGIRHGRSKRKEKEITLSKTREWVGYSHLFLMFILFISYLNLFLN